MARSRSRSPALKHDTVTSSSGEYFNKRRERSKSPIPIRPGSRSVASSKGGIHQDYSSRRRRSSSEDLSYKRKSSFSPNEDPDLHSRALRSPVRHHESERKTNASYSPQRGNTSISMLTRKVSSISPSPPRELIRPDVDESLRKTSHSKYDTMEDDVHYDRKKLAKIKIITPNLSYSNDEVDVKMRKRLKNGITTLEEVLELTLDDRKIGAKSAARYNSQEYETPGTKELKKIQIEIRRTIPRDRISDSPVRRSLRDPTTVIFSRMPEEGLRPIFDRPEIKHWIPDVPEKRVIALVQENSAKSSTREQSSSPKLRRVKQSDTSDRSARKLSRSRSPIHQGSEDGRMRNKVGRSSSGKYGSEQSELRNRRRKRQEDIKSQRNNTFKLDNVSKTRAFMDSSSPNGKGKCNVRSRLGMKKDSGIDASTSKSTIEIESTLYDEEKVLDRDELERLRYANSIAARPWESNPEMVPRGNYFEHDNRDSNPQSGYGNRGNNRFRGYDRRRSSLRGTARGRPWYKKGIEGRNRNVNRYLEADDKKPHTSNQPYQTSRQDRLIESRDRTRERSVDSGYYKPQHMRDVDAEKEPPFVRLPNEMIAKILSYIPHKQMMTSVSIVCKRFRQITCEDHLLLTDLEIGISSFSPKFEEQSKKYIQILNAAKRLRYLTIHVNDRLCGMLKAVGNNARNLRGLKILYSTGNFISFKEKEECSTHLISIAQNCKQLKELRLLINCSFYTMDLIKQMLIFRQDTLKTLEIDSFELNTDVFRNISKCKQLEELKLPQFMRLSKSCFLALNTKFANLKVLELCIRRLSDEYLVQGFSKCTSLEDLTLHQANKMAGDGIKALCKISTIKRLHISINSRGLLTDRDWYAAFVDGHLDNMEKLELTGYIDMNDYSVLDIVKRYSKLKSLKMEGVNNVGVECFKHLCTKFPYLRPLRINFAYKL